MTPGYYDVEFWETEQSMDAATGELGPETQVLTRWPGSRVLMMDGPDAIVEHHPVYGGRRASSDVVRRIDRVCPGWKAKFTKVDLPGGA